MTPPNRPPSTGTFELKFVTPDHAAQLLGRNVSNRSLADRFVANLASDMTDNRWMLTHEAICVGSDGVLIDGQHRLSAIVTSGVGQWLWVASGFPPETRTHVDLGRVRSVGDVLTLNGSTNANVLAASARLALLWEEYPAHVWTATTSIPRSAVVEYATNNLAALESVVDLGRIITARAPLLTRAASTAGLFIITQRTACPDLIDEFCDGVSNGVGLSSGDPRLALRNRGAITTEKSQWRTQSALAVLLKTWNAYARDEEVKLARFKRSELPMPVPV